MEQFSCYKHFRQPTATDALVLSKQGKNFEWDFCKQFIIYYTSEQNGNCSYPFYEIEGVCNSKCPSSYNSDL